MRGYTVYNQRDGSKQFFIAPSARMAVKCAYAQSRNDWDYTRYDLYDPRVSRDLELWKCDSFSTSNSPDMPWYLYSKEGELLNSSEEEDENHGQD